MLKRAMKLTSNPVGLALTVAGVVLALSPEARRATRSLLVRGTAGVLGTVDLVRERTGQALETAADTARDTARGTAHVIGETASHTLDAAEGMMQETAERMQPDERPLTH